MDLSPGTIVDSRFEIQSSLGGGGMGTVYRALQISIGRLVALKIIHRYQESSLESRTLELSRFEREAVALSSLQHRNIVSFYSYGFWQGRPFTVMEYVQGTTLQRRLEDDEPLQLPEALTIVKQVLGALEHAHRCGIIHRDLKPANIMMVRDEDDQQHPEKLSIKIVDFGLAKLTGDSGPQMLKLTKTGLAVGSVLYMSPEQCVGGAKLDARADLYAAGVLLHHCLTGSAPFQTPSVIETMQAHLMQEPPPLKSQTGQLWPDGLQGIVYKAMAKKPEHRYSSATEMLWDLKLVESGMGGDLTHSFIAPEDPSFALGSAPDPRSRNTLMGLLLAPIILGLVAACLWIGARDSDLVRALPGLLIGRPPIQQDSMAAEICQRLGRYQSAARLLALAGNEDKDKLEAYTFQMQAADALSHIEPTAANLKYLEVLEKIVQNEFNSPHLGTELPDSAKYDRLLDLAASAHARLTGAGIASLDRTDRYRELSFLLGTYLKGSGHYQQAAKVYEGLVAYESAAAPGQDLLKRTSSPDESLGEHRADHCTSCALCYFELGDAERAKCFIEKGRAWLMAEFKKAPQFGHSIGPPDPAAFGYIRWLLRSAKALEDINNRAFALDARPCVEDLYNQAAALLHDMPADCPNVSLADWKSQVAAHERKPTLHNGSGSKPNNKSAPPANQ